MTTPPLTRSVGNAERAMRALLERELASEGLTFAHWTALVFAGGTPLSPSQIAQRQLAGHVVASEAEALAAIARLADAALLQSAPDGGLQHTEAGRSLFAKLSKSVEDITGTLFAGLPEADLEATHRTLLEIAGRANKLLATK